MQQEAPDDFVDSLQPVLTAAVEGLTIVFAGPPSLLARAHGAGRLASILEIRKHVILRWLQVLNEVNPEFSCPRLMRELGAAADSDLNNGDADSRLGSPRGARADAATGRNVRRCCSSARGSARRRTAFIRAIGRQF